MAATADPCVVRALPGRLRVHVPGLQRAGPEAVVRGLARLHGVRDARASAITGNVLVRFDARATDAEAILAALVVKPVRPRPRVGGAAPPARPRQPAGRATVSRARVTALTRRGGRGRVRVAVPGIDRDPQIARRLVERLQDRRGVDRVVASATTGRVLVEFSHDVVTVQGLLAAISAIELPPVPEEEIPAHPLDPAPLIQSAARLIGASLGLGVLAARRAVGARDHPVAGGAPVAVAASIGVIEGTPAARAALRRLLGRDAAQLLLSGAAIVSLTLSGSPLGLVLNGALALQMLVEARRRRRGWEAYEARLSRVPPANPGSMVRVEHGDRVPLRARVIEGTGAAVRRDGRPQPVRPNRWIDAGSRVFGGPLVVELIGEEAFPPQTRAGPARASLLDRYLDIIGPVALTCAAGVAVLRRSVRSAVTALLLVNPRPALVGAEAADTAAASRVLRAGVVVVGTRPDRRVRRPDVLVIDAPRVLTDGWELSRLAPLAGQDPAELLPVIAAVMRDAGSPWGEPSSARAPFDGNEGDFDGETAHATVGRVRYALGPVDIADWEDAQARAVEPGDHLLALRAPDGRLLALVALRPRLATGVERLVATCRAHDVDLQLLPAGDVPAAEAIARRAGIGTPHDGDGMELLRERQRAGDRVMWLSDAASAARAFEASDLGVALSSGRSGHLPARADLLSPDLGGVAAIVEAGARRDEAVAMGVGVSAVDNLVGAAWGLRSAPAVARASSATHVTAVAAIAAAWLRLRGGEASEATLTRLVDPRPERWGRLPPDAVLQALDSRLGGLTSDAARMRGRRELPVRRRRSTLGAVVEQLRSPMTAVLAAGAGLSLALGQGADVALIAAVIAGNAVVGAWMERQAGAAAAALQRLGSPTARVLRDGVIRTVDRRELVTGDVLTLAPGDRVAADARLLTAHGLEIDESALTGESLPVRKAVDAGSDTARVVLEGSDVVVGTGRAVAVAVGLDTRLGATEAALELDGARESPLGRRLATLLRQGLPVVAAGGLIATVGGLAWGGSLTAQLTVGASIAIAAVPESLPLLAGMGEAAASTRLARRRALVRRLAAVEALGRVDVACFDKTGTLTAGRLAVARLASLDAEARFPGPLPPDLRDVLYVAALASPHPQGAAARAHPTDVAVVDAARVAGLGPDLERERVDEAPFEPTRGYHAAVVGDRLCVKGAAEVLAPRCIAARRHGRIEPLGDAGGDELLAAADRLSAQGLRVLLVAQGTPRRPAGELDDLVVLGFLCIADPLRPGVTAAVRRCREAGVRLVMLTGDHPATARAIGREAGLDLDDGILLGDELAELDGAELEERLERASIIARITPLDKVRIVETLRRRGHTVAMTGDGVNDAPALRLADVGVAMGASGTEVARQAADVVLTDDDFATLVEALVEGRVFWQNIRRALGILLGGNLGEMALMAGASLTGPSALLSPRQILAVNLGTDVLPAVALVVQGPEHRTLSALAREGAAALDQPLRREILRRGAATALPSLGAYVLARRGGGAAQSVAFASLVATQLAQTVSVGVAERRLSRPVARAVAGSAALLVAAFAVPSLRSLLGLAALGPAEIALVAGACVAAVVLGGGAADGLRSRPPALLPAAAR